MKLLSTVVYRADTYLRSPIHQRVPFGRMLCIRTEASWCINCPTSQDLHPYAAGGASAINT